MFCTKCGFELREKDCFCSHCGAQTPTAATQFSGASGAYPLRLDKRNKKVAGVCAGFARHLGVDLVLMRVLWLAAALCTGVGFLAYLAAWIVIPSDHGELRNAEMVRVPQSGVTI